MSRARKIPDRRQPLRPQRVERVSVMPQDMKSKDVAIPNQEKNKKENHNRQVVVLPYQIKKELE